MPSDFRLRNVRRVLPTIGIWSGAPPNWVVVCGYVRNLQQMSDFQLFLVARCRSRYTQGIRIAGV